MACTEVDPRPAQQWAKDFLDPVADDAGLPLDVMRDLAREYGLDYEAECEFEIERLRDLVAALREKLDAANDLVEARLHVTSRRRPG